MPFSWFGGNTTSSTTTTADAETSERSHARKVSLLSNSSSGGGLGNSSTGKSSRLAGVRAETRASYLRKELNLSGDLSTSRSRRGRTNNHRSSSQAMIVAVEPDSDVSEHRRIDQGLIDASMEAASNNSVLHKPPSSSDAGFVHQSNTNYWWGGFSTATATAAPPPPTPTASTLPTPTTCPQIPLNNTNHIKLGISHSAHVPKSSSSSSSSSTSSMPKSNLQHRRTVSNKFRVP